MAWQESNVEALSQENSLTNPTELRSFLGLANYCARFVKDLANIVHPLRQLTKNGLKWEWTEAHQTAFNELKSKLTTDSIRYYDPELTSRVIVGARPLASPSFSFNTIRVSFTCH
jgi:hypothetical protein